MFCVCCLDSCSPSYVRLRSCNHSRFLEDICKIHVQDMVLCGMCHRMLVKCYDFRKHIQKSVLLIAKQATETSKTVRTRKLNTLHYTSPLIVEITQDSHFNAETGSNQYFGDCSNKFARGDIELACPDIDPIRDTFNHSTVNIKTEIQDDTDPLINKMEIKVEPLDIIYPPSCSNIKIENENSKNLHENELLDTSIEDVSSCLLIEKNNANPEDESDHNMDCDVSTAITSKDGCLETFEEQYQGKLKKITLTTDEVLAEIAEKRLNEEYQNRSYKCDDCVLGFSSPNSLLEHRNKWHTQAKPNSKRKLHECQICKRMFRYQPYITHITEHHTRFDCGSCDTRFHLLSGAVSHYNSTHGVHTGNTLNYRGHSCNMCSADFGTRVEYSVHMSEEHHSGPECDECGKTLSSDNALKVHKRLVHTATDPSEMIPCPHCDKRYKTVTSLRSHVSSKHIVDGSRNGAEYCQDCDVVFNNRPAYLYHLKTHAHKGSDKHMKFVCAHCDRKFPMKSTLRRHIEWAHLNVARHYCSLCDKRFQNATRLREHTDTVHYKIPKKKDKICEICGRAFTVSKCLVQHMRTHTGERPLRCDVCDATFAQSAALYNHRKLKHKILPKNANT